MFYLCGCGMNLPLCGESIRTFYFTTVDDVNGGQQQFGVSLLNKGLLI